MQRKVIDGVQFGCAKRRIGVRFQAVAGDSAANSSYPSSLMMPSKPPGAHYSHPQRVDDFLLLFGALS
jgi:hypothetical protein